MSMLSMHSDLVRDVDAVDARLLRKTTTSAGSLSFYAPWLINDDLFQVMSCHFAVSLFARRLQTQPIGDRFCVSSIVMPRSVTSL